MSIILIILQKVRNIPTQPCCGYFLHGGTRFVGLIDFGLSLFVVVLMALEMYRRFDSLLNLYQNKEYIKYYFRAASWATYVTTQFILLALSILLFKAAEKRSERLCKVWIGLSTVTNLTFLATFYINHYLFSIPAAILIMTIFYTVYKLYCLHAVWVFVKEIQSYGGFNAAMRGLTDAEVKEFERGGSPDRKLNDRREMIQNMGFNKDFEIPLENLEMDENIVLGSGAFGCVYRGKIRRETGTKCVAIKTVKQNADSAYFKTLLSELKVMIYVGHHENVVSLLGACTANIKQKILYVVEEFCPFGNLHGFLKARRGLFVNFVEKGEIRTDFKDGGKFAYSNINAGSTITTLDIFNWMHQSSKGLEYLEEKKVIHGDIALRNILLGYGKVAKISDFGLSKKLYQYTSVIKKEILLPFRWMALESLIDMEFSIKSDVWSFAVTIWEAFSLSELPFPGFTWDKEFVGKVRNGLRMSQPRNATNEIYELMVKCWEPEPENRPSFKEVADELGKMLKEAYLATRNLDKKNPISQYPNEHNEEDEIEMYIPNGMIADGMDENTEVLYDGFPDQF